MFISAAKQRWAPAVAAFAAVGVGAGPAWATSTLAIGPRTVQSLVAAQLFNRSGRWYLIDQGPCFTYLDAPRAHLEADRLVLNAHLTSRLGQSLGDSCAGADFASNVTLTGKVRGADHNLLLDDIRIERVDDESTRNALALALQLAPDALPKSARIDVMEFFNQQVAAGKPAARLDQLRIVNIVTRADGVSIQFDMGLSAP